MGKTAAPNGPCSWSSTASPAAVPRLKFILLQNGGGVSGTEYPRSGGGDVVGPAIFGHAGAAAAITVGAVPYNNRTGRALLLARSGDPLLRTGRRQRRGAPLGSPEVISKPEVAATDCGRTTFFSFQPEKEPGIWRFCGTSAAAPHAAGIAALALEAGAGGPAEVAAALAGTGRTVGTFGPCAAGAGLLDALTAVEAVTAARPRRRPPAGRRTAPIRSNAPPANGVSNSRRATDRT